MIKTLLVQASKPIGNQFGGIGPLGNTSDWGVGPRPALTLFEKVLSRTIGFMTIIAGLWFIFQLIIGAYGYISAGGDQKAVETASKKITSAVLGLFIVVAAYALISLIGKLVGLDILNPQNLIFNMW